MKEANKLKIKNFKIFLIEYRRYGHSKMKMEQKPENIDENSADKREKTVIERSEVDSDD